MLLNTEEGTYNYTISEKREDHPEKEYLWSKWYSSNGKKSQRNQEGKLTTEVTYKGRMTKVV